MDNLCLDKLSLSYTSMSCAFRFQHKSNHSCASEEVNQVHDKYFLRHLMRNKE